MDVQPEDATPDGLQDLLKGGEVPAASREPSKVPMFIAFLHLLITPVLLTVWLTRALQEPDRTSAEDFARLLFFPIGDPVLVASGVVQAFSGYFVANEVAIAFSAIPLFFGTLIPTALQAACFVLIWWGVSALARRRRTNEHTRSI